MSCFLEETTLEFPSKSGMLAVANVKNLSDRLPENLSILYKIFIKSANFKPI